jgi:hypothetical protein
MFRQTLGTVYSRFVVNVHHPDRAKIEVWEADIYRLWGRAEDSPVIDPLSKPILDLDPKGN